MNIMLLTSEYLKGVLSIIIGFIAIALLIYTSIVDTSYPQKELDNPNNVAKIFIIIRWFAMYFLFAMGILMYFLYIFMLFIIPGMIKK